MKKDLLPLQEKSEPSKRYRRASGRITLARLFRRNGHPHAIYTRDPNASYMNDAGKAACRLPSGHPEAFFE